MRLFQRLSSFCLALVVCFSLFMISSIAAFADSSVSVTADDADITLTIPSDFTVFTSEDLDRSADYYKNLPITKNEAIRRVDSGVLIDAFSNDKTREIRFSVFQSNEIGKYAETATRAAATLTATATLGNSLISGINNFSALSADERSSVISAVSSELKNNGHTLLSTPSEIQIGDYYYIRIYARIGDSDLGYTYTTVMTIVGGKCYELTCYDNSPVLEQKQIDSNNTVTSSLKLAISGNSGELAANNFQSVIVFIVIFLSIAIIVGVIISFIQPVLANRNSEEPIKPKKRK